jgi:hypothetical protein
MTSKEYVIWLNGFVEACHEYAPTPKQWDALKDKLAEVSDEEKSIGTPKAFGGWGMPNITPNSTPYTINCSTGSSGTTTGGYIVTTTPGTTGFITTCNYPYTTTIWNPSGSAWSYTNSINKDINEENENKLRNNGL